MNRFSKEIISIKHYIMTRQTVCLNMIVKNEEHVIYNCLDKLKHLFDTFVIVDTGSTDSTIEKIKDFSSKNNIKGEIIQNSYNDDFYFDFAKNRTFALEKCYGKSDYILVFDADDIIQGDFSYPSTFGQNDIYRVRLKSSVYYYRPLIFRNDPKLEFKYVCPIHEYLDHHPKATSYTISEGNYYVESRRLGDRNKNPNKYQNDALVLEEAIKNTPENAKHYPRLVFYCAQSHRAYNNYSRAIELYWKRYNMENTWVQERYYSLLLILFMDNSRETLNKVFIESEKLNLEREEIRYKCFSSNCFDDDVIIKSFTRRIPKKNINIDHILFYHKDLNESMYKWYEEWVDKKIYYELQIMHQETNYKIYNKVIYDKLIEKVCYYKDTNLLSYLALENKDPNINLMIADIEYKNKNYEKGYKLACKILDTYGRSLKNFENAERIRDQFVDHILKVTRKDHNFQYRKRDTKRILVTLTCCKRYDLMKPTLNSFFNCCTDVILVDHFLCIDDNSSEEDRVKMRQDFPMFEYIMKTPEQKGHAISMNMIYDYAVDNNFEYVFHMEDDWQFVQELPYIQKCIEVLESEESYVQCIPNRNNAEIPNYQRKIGRGKYINNPPHILHEHFSIPSLKLQLRSDNFKNCINISYWGSFTFHTGMWKMKNVKTLGHFSTDGFFEKDYATDSLLCGFKLTFLDTFSYYNIGRKSWEPSGDNAYTINQVSQHGSDESIKIYVKCSLDYFDYNWKDFKASCYENLKFQRFYGNLSDFDKMDSLRMLIPDYNVISEIDYNTISTYNFEPGFKYNIEGTDIIVCDGKVNSDKEIYILSNLDLITKKRNKISYEIPGFVFVPFCDIQGHDIQNIETPFDDDTPLEYDSWMKWIKHLSERCLRLGGSSFNTFGYIKNSSEPPVPNKWFHKGYHGIYIMK